MAVLVNGGSDFALKTTYEVATAPYLALVGNVNADMVDAALGKNNEEIIKGVGKALAMYAKWHDSTKVISSAFINLMSCQTVADIKNSIEAYNELITSDDILGLILVSDYFKTSLFDLVDSLSGTGSSSGTYTTTMPIEITESMIESDDKLIIVYELYANRSYCYAKVSFNGMLVASSPAAGWNKGATALNLSDYGVLTAGTYNLQIERKQGGASGDSTTSGKAYYYKRKV